MSANPLGWTNRHLLEFKKVPNVIYVNFVDWPLAEFHLRMDE